MRPGTATRNRIRREALALFVAHGVDAVSVRDIATAAGCTPSSLYTHWPSLGALIEELFAEGYAAYGRALAEIAARPLPFPARLEAMIRRICALHAEDRVLFEFLLLTQHRGLHAAASTPVEPDANPIEVLHRVVATAMAEGELPQGDPALLTAALVGVVVQAATFAHYGRIARGLDAMADEIVALCLRLIAAEPEGARR
ncbi:MAG: TetR/AcrR family transcriptional regulator [Acetobacteraceae bacterium]|nr:TetR/AcrR family transcriptional regulator [Acetobacteraceae bacterium]